MSRIALVVGAPGQDGYAVDGVVRRSSSLHTPQIDHLWDPHEQGTWVFLHYDDLTDGSRLVRLLEKIQPDEAYNLAAQSHVRVSFEADLPALEGPADRRAVGGPAK